MHDMLSVWICYMIKLAEGYCILIWFSHRPFSSSALWPAQDWIEGLEKQLHGRLITSQLLTVRTWGEKHWCLSRWMKGRRTKTLCGRCFKPVVDYSSFLLFHSFTLLAATLCRPLVRSSVDGCFILVILGPLVSAKCRKGMVVTTHFKSSVFQPSKITTVPRVLFWTKRYKTHVQPWRRWTLRIPTQLASFFILVADGTAVSGNLHHMCARNVKQYLSE